MTRRAVVVGGAGAVGRLFTERLLGAGAEVTVVDPADAPVLGAARRTRGDITDPGPALTAELGRADLVVLAVPEPVALAALPGLAGALAPGAVLADTLSVKQAVTRAVREHAPGVQAVGLNPMFAPALGFAGRPVAAVVVHDGPGVVALLALIQEWGATVVRVDAAEHDRLAAASQALTHAAVLGFGLALTGTGVSAADLRPIAPPPATTLLALLARVASGTPEVYWDVQHANAEAGAVRKALAEAVHRVADTVEHGTEADFAALLGELRAYLGDDLAHHRDTCARLFAQP
ncbi:prephenate dehydrogenase/arogenate dehydrogenase family protein [Streptomyces sp. NPDC007903]|uniref:prephenate dehydrogenase/arogenate dehydrogenase family protein n=1 Tax=Streptomyces sp. NPDC007903 TaxID=3364786 RepID=UPI0036E93763